MLHTIDLEASDSQVCLMQRQSVIKRINARKSDLNSLGLTGVSLFGSVARGESSDSSDIDLAVTLDADNRVDLFRFAVVSERLTRLLGGRVDVVVEPTRNRRLQAEIDRDRIRVF